MEDNLRIPSWLLSAMIKAHIKSSLHPRPLNRMEQWNRKIGLFRRWHVSCYTIKSCPNPFGEKQLTLLVIHSTGCILDLIPRRLLMNSGEERSRLLSILGYLVMIATFYVIERIQKNLMQRVTRDIFQGTPLLVEHIECII